MNARDVCAGIARGVRAFDAAMAENPSAAFVSILMLVGSVGMVYCMGWNPPDKIKERAQVETEQRKKWYESTLPMEIPSDHKRTLYIAGDGKQGFVLTYEGADGGTYSQQYRTVSNYREPTVGPRVKWIQSPVEKRLEQRLKPEVKP